MLKVVDDAICQLFHGRWAEEVSYSRHGSWRCTKADCGAQARFDRDLVRSSAMRSLRPAPVALHVRPERIAVHRRAA